MKIKKIVALTAACAMLSSTAGCQIITIDGIIPFPMPDTI